MTRKPSESNDLLLTEAQPVPPPHDVTVPEPPSADQSGMVGRMDPEVLRELRRLAERVGGLEKLKEVIDIMLRFPR